MIKKIYPVLLLTFVNTLGFSILIPVLPFIVRKSGYPDFVYGFLISAYSTSQFFGSLVLGSLSDIYGRKPILVFSQAGTLLSWFVFVGAWVIGEQYGWVTMSLMIIGLARITDGLTGGNTTVANAYLSDILKQEQRGMVFGYVGAVVGLGIIVGPAIGAMTSASEIGYLGMILFSIALSTVTLLAIIMKLRESLAPQDRVHERPEEGFTQESFLKTKVIKNLNIFHSIKIFKNNEAIMSIFVVKLFVSTAMAANSTTIMLLLIDRFSFDQKQIGFFLLVVGGFLMFNQVFIVKRFISYFGENLTLLLSLLLTGIGILVFPALDNLILFIAFYYLTNLGISLSFPTIRAIAAREASKNLQGKVMGIDESIFSISMAIIPFTSASLYNWLDWKAFYIWALTSIFGACYYLWKNFARITNKADKNPIG